MITVTETPVLLSKTEETHWYNVTLLQAYTALRSPSGRLRESAGRAFPESVAKRMLGKDWKKKLPKFTWQESPTKQGVPGTLTIVRNGGKVTKLRKNFVRAIFMSDSGYSDFKFVSESGKKLAEMGMCTSWARKLGVLDKGQRMGDQRDLKKEMQWKFSIGGQPKNKK